MEAAVEVSVEAMVDTAVADHPSHHLTTELLHPVVTAAADLQVATAAVDHPVDIAAVDLQVDTAAVDLQVDIAAVDPVVSEGKLIIKKKRKK